jgi:hypothetical protein
MIPELLVNHFNPKISSSDMLTDFDSNLVLIYETAIKNVKKIAATDGITSGRNPNEVQKNAFYEMSIANSYVSMTS